LLSVLFFTILTILPFSFSGYISSYTEDNVSFTKEFITSLNSLPYELSVYFYCQTVFLIWELFKVESATGTNQR